PIYRLMFSEKGFPNRWRIDRYRELVQRAGLRISKLEPTQRLPADKVALIEPHLAGSLRGISSEELSWMGFWLVLEPASGADGAGLPQQHQSSRAAAVPSA